MNNSVYILYINFLMDLGIVKKIILCEIINVQIYWLEKIMSASEIIVLDLVIR